LKSQPKGFLLVDEGRRRALVKKPCLYYLQQKGLLDPGGIFRDMKEAPFRGRGSLLLLEGEVALVIRQYLHGGLLRALNRDLFFFGDRPLRELSIMVRLLEAGVRTLEPVAAIRERVGPFYRGYLVTRYLPRAVDLLTYLQGNPPLEERRRVLRKAAEVTRRVHDLGVFHRDLHLRNFLVDGGEVYLIDFDRALEGDPSNLRLRMKNLSRLLRSVEKFRRRGLPITLSDELAFWRAYSRGDGDLERALRDYLRRQRLRMTLWRVGWWVEGILYRA